MRIEIKTHGRTMIKKYELDENTRAAIKNKIPGLLIVSHVEISDETADDFVRIHGRDELENTIIAILTGTNKARLVDAGFTVPVFV